MYLKLFKVFEEEGHQYHHCHYHILDLQSKPRQDQNKIGSRIRGDQVHGTIVTITVSTAKLTLRTTNLPIHKA